jgi:hypothetical protein
MPMNDGVWRDDAGEREWADDDAKQHHQHGLLHGPK